MPQWWWCFSGNICLQGLLEWREITEWTSADKCHIEIADVLSYLHRRHNQSDIAPYPSEKASLQCSHKQFSINESQTCLVHSAHAGKRHSQGYRKSNENTSALGHEQRAVIKAKITPKTSFCFVPHLQNHWISKWEQYVLAAWPECRHGPGQSPTWLPSSLMHQRSLRSAPLRVLKTQKSPSSCLPHFSQKQARST